MGPRAIGAMVRDRFRRRIPGVSRHLRGANVDPVAAYMPHRMKYMMPPMTTIQMKRQRSNIRQLMVGMDFLMG